MLSEIENKIDLDSYEEGVLYNMSNTKQTGEKQLQAFTDECKKTITKVNDRVYHFYGYGHSNAIAIIGDTSIILVDALDCDGYAKTLRQELQYITDKPVKTLIFTHSHPDHMGGSGAFQDTVEEIIAFQPISKPLKYYDRLQDILMLRGKRQHGYGLQDAEAISQGIGIREGKETGHGSYAFLKPTTLYQEASIHRIIDGVSLSLVRAPGECDDEIFVYLEDDHIMCCGDNYYGCWPNLYAIRGTTYRDIATWVSTLETILQYDMEALLPGHTKVIIGKDAIQFQLGMFKDAIEFVLLETLDAMNQGLTLSQCVERVKLPQKYLDQPFLKEFYGTVEWSVKSIYQGYLGWFDGTPETLLPCSDKAYQDTLRNLIGESKLLEKIKTCMQEEDYQMALQLLVLVDEPALRKQCLLKRAKQTTSANARHYFIACAKE